jgi:predicted permease
MLSDFRFALRVLSKAPGFTTVAVLVLAVAIGGTTAMFTIINALLFRPLPLEAPANLVRVYLKTKPPASRYSSFSYPHFLELRDRNTAFADLTAFTLTMVGANEGEMARRTMAGLVPANFFRTLGVAPALGRVFTPEEERPGSAIPVVVLGHIAWQRLGSDPAIVGRTIRLNSREFQVVGVMPEGFAGITAMFSTDYWLPLGVHDLVSIELMNDRRQTLDDRSYMPLLLVGRLRPGLDSAVAQAQLEPLAAQLAEIHPAELKEQVLELGPLSRLSISTAPDTGTKGMAVFSALLLGMSGAVLLIACLNLANMLLARGTSRRREVAVRVALGGGRWRIVRQLLVESLLLALAGGALGLLLSTWATELLAASLSTKIPLVSIVFDSRPDWHVLLATFGFCVVSVLVFALGPAWKLSQADVLTHLKQQPEGPLGGAGGRSVFAPRNLLVVAQIALSLALLASAGLFVRGAFNAARANPGFSTEHHLLAEVDAGFVGYDNARARQLFITLQEELAAVPGVQSVSFAALVPFGLTRDGHRVAPASAESAPAAPATEGAPAAPAPASVSATSNVVATGYFRTLGVPLLRGREFERIEIESSNAPRVAIIDEPLARRLWPDSDPVGRRLVYVENGAPDPTTAMEVVGVVGGVLEDLSEREPGPHIYLPFGQDFRRGVTFHVKTAPTGPEGEAMLLHAVRDTLRRVDAQLPILSLQSFHRFHSDGLMVWITRTGAQMFAIFGGLALFLAVVGVYGVKAYVVARRTREIGIRMALGASRREVLAMVLREGLWLTACGVGCGWLLAAATGKALSSILYGVSAFDPLVLIVTPLLLGGAALLACYLPARRAARVQPMVALRNE